jgi:hypothetical protein
MRHFLCSVVVLVASTLVPVTAVGETTYSGASFEEVLRLPWDADLPYERTDLGGAEDNVPTDLEVDSGGRFWIIYNWGYPVVIVHPSGHTRLLSLKEVFPDEAGVRLPYAYRVADSGGEQVVLLAGGRSERSGRFLWALGWYDVSGTFLRSLELEPEVFGADTPDCLETVLSGGCLSDGEVSEAVGAGARVVDTEGNDAFLAVREVEQLEVYLGSHNGRRDTTEASQIASLPLLRLQPSPEDGARIASWFPPEGIAFDSEGGVVAMEVTPEALVIRRLWKAEGAGKAE